MFDTSQQAAVLPRRFLLVTHVVPYPASAGNELRIYRLLLWLKDLGYQVVLLLTVPDASLTQEQRQALQELVYRLHTLPAQGDLSPRFPVAQRGIARLEASAQRYARKRKLGPLWWRVREGTGQILSRLQVRLPPTLLLPPHIGVEEHLGTPPILNEVARLCLHYRPAVVLAEYVFMTRCLQNLPPQTLKVVDCHDVFSKRAEKVVAAGIVDPIAITAQQEAELLARADLILAIQPAERCALQALAPGRKVITVGIDIPVRASAQPPRPAQVLCVASDNHVNVQSLQEFVDHAWPQILRECPDAKLQIVGKAAPKIQTDDEASILRSGFVESLDAAYEEATVVVNPVYAGTGLKIKTVEALAHGKALVAFANGVEGLPDACPPPFRLAGDWHGFAIEITRLLHAPESRRQLEQQALSFARCHFSRNAAYGEFAHALGRWQVGQSLS